MSVPILYLHGVGEKVRAGAWFHALNAALARQGVAPRRLQEDVWVPDYVDLLGLGARAPRTAAPPTTADAGLGRGAREDYMSERQRLVAELDAPSRAARQPVPMALYEAGRHTWGLVSRTMRHVEHYRRHAHLRHGVLHRALRTLGEHRGDLVVVAHSLGSLVALDLLPRLPPGVRVRRLVTLGSPAGWPSLHRLPGDEPAGRSDELFPYDRVGSWVNIHSPLDLVSLGRGSSRLFPAAVDVTTRLPTGRHGAELYVASEVFARALGGVLVPARTG